MNCRHCGREVRPTVGVWQTTTPNAEGWYTICTVRGWGNWEHEPHEPLNLEEVLADLRFIEAALQ